MNSNPSHPNPPKLAVLLAFAVVYLVWGSTYLGIRFAIESIPVFLMAGSRFFVAGIVLYFITRALGHRASKAHWKSALILGLLLLMIGNGFVTLAEKSVPSGIAALTIAVVPVWTVLLDWLRPGGMRPRILTLVGVFVGIAGVIVLVLAKDANGHQVVSLGGGLLLLLATLSWSSGTIYSRTAPRPDSIILFSGMQMIVGGAAMLLVSIFRGELAGFDPAGVTRHSFLAWLYLMLIGGILAFTTFAWLLKVSTPTKVATNAFVNPLIAVILGSTLAGEPLSDSIILAAAAIIAAVVMMTISRTEKRQPEPEEEEAIA